LPSDIIEVLRHHREQQREIQASALHWEDLDLVFCTRAGSYILPNYIHQVFERLLKKAGLGHMKFHALRHNASLILRRLKIDAVVRMEILGHTRLEMTDGVYGHTTPEMHQEAAQELDRSFRKEKEEGT
jgi:integrase